MGMVMGFSEPEGAVGQQRGAAGPVGRAAGFGLGA